MRLLKTIFTSVNYGIYLLKIYFRYLLGSKIVVYTKKHPIFTACFEENPPAGYVFFYRSNITPFEKVNCWLYSKTALYHMDAANFYAPDNNKPIVVECEALPDPSFFTNPQIKHILFESLSAGRFHLGQPNVSLLYPAINPKLNSYKPDEEYTTILCVGFGGMIKGYDVVFRLYEELKTKYKIKLIIAGSLGHNFSHYPEVSEEAYEKADFKTIKDKLLSDNNVLFRPFSRKKLIKSVYPKADIYLHLSRMETFGFSILEAMSFGLPVIAPNFKAIPEMVEHGKNGFLVSSMDFDTKTNDYTVNINSSEWADRCYGESLGYLKRLIEDTALRNQMGEAGIKKISDIFDLGHKRETLENIYSSVFSQ